MSRMPPLYTCAGDEYVHVMTGFRKAWDDLRYRCVVCEVCRDYSGRPAEFLYCLEGLLVALISLPVLR